jgi:hypothetical protein
LQLLDHEDSVEPELENPSLPLDIDALMHNNTIRSLDEPEEHGHVLSATRRSGRIATKIAQVHGRRWGAGNQVLIREDESDEQSEDEDPVVDGGDERLVGCGDKEDEEDEEDDWQKLTSANPGQEGIPLWDWLGQGFLKMASELGTLHLFLSFMFLIYSYIHADEHSLGDEDKALLRAYAYKIDERLTDKAFNKLHFVFPTAPIESLKRTETRVQSLSGFQPVRYDRCINSCICYTGPYEDLGKCPVCSIDRYRPDGSPQAYFTYLPIIPRLRALVANSSYATKMKYRANYQGDPSHVSDVFDGAHYCSLLTQNITIADETLPIWFFSDPRDIALGFSTDGFGPFKLRDRTAWPIILLNYNLPPEERFQKHNIISVGVIPGPKKPVDADSYLWPLVQEFLQLAVGVTAFDALTKTLFLLHAFLIIVFGDMPAIAMIMRMKGHNAKRPCRICKIEGIRNDISKTLYIPLDRTGFPDSVASRKYNPSALPLRSHEEFMKEAEEVQNALNTATSERLSSECGIKGIPLLSVLSSLSFPRSFPYDFMHLIWENLIPNLILLWTGNFKNLDHSDESYVIAKTVWEVIGEATEAAGKTIPAAFGARLPNIALEKAHLSAEMRSIWTIYLAPILLRGRFQREQYYKHFLELVSLLKLCLEFQLSEHQIDELEEGFKAWVVQYEKYVVCLAFLALTHGNPQILL